MFPREVSILLKISRCATQILGCLGGRVQRAPQGAAEGVAGLDLGLHGPLRGAGKTACMMGLRDRICDCFPERSRFCTMDSTSSRTRRRRSRLRRALWYATTSHRHGRLSCDAGIATLMWESAAQQKFWGASVRTLRIFALFRVSPRKSIDRLHTLHRREPENRLAVAHARARIGTNTAKQYL